MERVEPTVLEHAVIYGHNVWHYVLYTTIGDIHIVEYEGEGLQLFRTITDWDERKAEHLFKRYCKDLLNGKGV
jgi:ureidoglycolate hydrolase